MAVTWADDRDEHLARHGVTIAQAEQALADPERVVWEPDYASVSGRGTRTIGWSADFGDLLAVLTYIDVDGVRQGSTAFRAKGKDRRYYYERQR